MPANVVIIGAGTGGTAVANKIYRKVKSKAEITVIDATFKHPYQPGTLFSMFKRETQKSLTKDGKKLFPKKVNLVQDIVTLVDTENKVVKTKGGKDVPYDYLVLSPGARYAKETAEWWDDSIHEFYTMDGADKLADALENFQGGNIVVSIADIPYKCPPAPIEAAMLIDDYFKKRNMRDKVNITYTSPLGRAFSIETTNTRVEQYLKEKNIPWKTLFNVEDVDTEEKVIYSMEGDDIDYDLLVMVPPHRGQQFLIDSGISKGHGWIPTDRETLEVEGQENMWALGDATNIATSKAGSTAHYSAPVIAANIAALIKGEEKKAIYDGHVQCFFLTEMGKSMFIDFNFSRPPKPSPTRKIWWWFKLLFKPMYFSLVARGYV
ncbi:MAG: NAD(P)/FAD-dependent oxidoreductase [Candidatus Heimdallarchaeota archaeon]|nr:NAD(P)/FAD-dependent oxidoreductase [Candidatus Heimdallarchaeota archaeon]